MSKFSNFYSLGVQENKKKIMDANYYLSIIIPSVSLALMVLYHIYYFIALLAMPRKISLGINLETRRRWVFMVMFKENKDIFVVQSFRNSITATSVFIFIRNY